jgi:hypothetical protein
MTVTADAGTTTAKGATVYLFQVQETTNNKQRYAVGMPA